jgi:hypothetical protein
VKSLSKNNRLDRRDGHLAVWILPDRILHLDLLDQAPTRSSIGSSHRASTSASTGVSSRVDPLADDDQLSIVDTTVNG